MGTAFGPEGMVILHMLSTIAPLTPVFNLDTGYQFPETLAMQQRVWERYGIQVTFERAALTTEQFESCARWPRLPKRSYGMLFSTEDRCPATGYRGQVRLDQRDSTGSKS